VKPVGRFFLRKYWNKDMSMEQIAELGYFVIKTIETYNVDETIALSKKTGDSSLVRVSLSCIVPFRDFNMSHRLDV